MGITVNLKFPMLNWESETVVVKQSTAVIVAILVSFISFGVPIATLLVLPDINVNIMMCITTLMMCIITIVLYQWNNKIELKNII